jgi:hypothetical protein
VDFSEGTSLVLNVDYHLESNTQINTPAYREYKREVMIWSGVDNVKQLDNGLQLSLGVVTPI